MSLLSLAARRLLIVDDNAAHAHLIQLYLRRLSFGLKVDWVEDGDEALTLLAGLDGDSDQHPPDLILLDLHMRRLDGFEVLEHLRNHPRLSAIPVLAMSNLENERDKQRACELGADGYLVKPMDLAQWQDVMGSVVSLLATPNRLPQACVA